MTHETHNVHCILSNSIPSYNGEGMMTVPPDAAACSAPAVVAFGQVKTASIINPFGAMLFMIN